MNIHQTTALMNHCRFAFEIAQSKFAYLLDSPLTSVILTVNSGYE